MLYDCRMRSPLEIGKTIATARGAWDLDETALAKRADVAPAIVAQAEAGDASVADLAAIARALGGTYDDLTSGRAFWEAPAVAFRNAPTKVDAHVIRQSLLRLAGVGRDRTALATMIDVPKGNTSLQPRHVVEDLVEQAEQLAIETRKALANPCEPIISVRESMRRLGIATVLAQLGCEEVDGMSWRDADGSAFAVANVEARSSGVTALRMTFAHELCHLLFDGTAGRAFGIVEQRTDHGEALEKRANAFAAHFLAPRDAIARFLRERGLRDGQKPTAQHLLALSEHFLIGVEAAAWQLVNTHYWSKDDVYRHKHLATRIPHGEDDAEVLPTDAERIVPLERRGEILELATLALESDRISIGRWREFVGVSANADWSRLLSEREVVHDVEHRST